ncbi:short chain dehydrogenase [compost metagenome]
MSTILIIGAGEGFGLSIAKQFGLKGHNVALIAYNKDNLDSYVRELGLLNIKQKALSRMCAMRVR